jgi:ribosomal protein S18 acetylase RimI-like enzyme
MLQACINLAKSRKASGHHLKYVILYTYAANHAARNMYKKAGFNEVAHGQDVNVVLMVLKL